MTLGVYKGLHTYQTFAHLHVDEARQGRGVMGPLDEARGVYRRGVHDYELMESEPLDRGKLAL